MIFLIPLAFLIFRLMTGFSPSRVAFETIVLVVIVSWFNQKTRMGLDKILKALANGTLQGILIVSTMAASGVLIGIIDLTGIGIKFSSLYLWPWLINLLLQLYCLLCFWLCSSVCR